MIPKYFEEYGMVNRAYPVLHNQWKVVLNIIPEIFMDLRLQLIQQKYF